MPPIVPPTMGPMLDECLIAGVALVVSAATEVVDAVTAGLPIGPWFFCVTSGRSVTVR